VPGNTQRLISLTVLPKRSVTHAYCDLKDELEPTHFQLVRARSSLSLTILLNKCCHVPQCIVLPMATISKSKIERRMDPIVIRNEVYQLIRKREWNCNHM